MVHSFIWFEDANKSLSKIGHMCLFFPLFLCKPSPGFMHRCLIEEQFVSNIKPLFCLWWNLVHCRTHWRLPFEQWVGDWDMYSIVYKSHPDSLKFNTSYIFLITLETFSQSYRKLDELIWKYQWPYASWWSIFLYKSWIW